MNDFYEPVLFSLSKYVQCNQCSLNSEKKKKHELIKNKEQSV